MGYLSSWLGGPLAAWARAVAVGALAAVLCGGVWAADEYRLRPGDKLTVSVWGEEGLDKEVLIQPDGMMVFPLTGRVQAAGLTTDELRARLAEHLAKFIENPEVTVAVVVPEGNTVYVIGQVVKPGMFPMATPLDVMQALSLAGGLTPFADHDDIKILRREGVQGQAAFDFSYDDVAAGEHMETNILLKGGDVVVVP